MKGTGIVSALCAMALCFGLAIYGINQVEAAGTNTAAQKSVLLNLTQPIEAQKTSMASAKFAELTPEAMKVGMGEATINGSIEFKMLEDRTIRSSIRWDSISIENGGKKVTEGLETSLSSMFRMQQDKPRAEPGTKVKAVGDLEALATALGKLKARLDEKDVVQKETNNSKTQAQVSPVVSNAQDANSGKYLSDVGTPFNTVVETGTSTSYELCSDRFVDLGAMKAFKQYKPVYTKNGVQSGEGVCAPNSSEFATIQQKDGACTYRYDMANSTAIKQTQFFYTDNGTDVLVGGCRDATTTYPLYESRTGCPVTTDTANMKVFPQSRLVFKAGSTEQNATECRAVSGSTGIALSEEACEPMFEHDFVNNVSYLLTKLYYIDPETSQKVYINACGRSSSVSFPHIFDTSGCGWTLDDEKMLGMQQARTIIKTGAIAGDVIIQDCHTIATVNYTYVGTATKNQKFVADGTFTIPAGTVSTAALIVGRGQYGNNRYDNDGNSCVNGFPGKAGQVMVQDFGTQKGVIDIRFNQGSGTFPGDTVLTLNGQTFTALSGGNEDPFWHWVTGEAVSCPVEHNFVQGFTTTGRFGISSQLDYPKSGGCGYGAGGRGGMTTASDISMCPNSKSTAEVINAPYGYGVTLTTPAPGVVIIEYKVNSYMRPDGTSYTPGQ